MRKLQCQWAGSRRACALALVLAGALPGGQVLAGPPLSIDDPDILDPGQFEIILAAYLESRDQEDQYAMPNLDVSYGVSENFQVGATLRRIVLDPDGSSPKSDFGVAVLNAKWRFLRQQAVQMSVSPQYSTPFRDGAVDRGLVVDDDVWTLPVEFQSRPSASSDRANPRRPRQAWTTAGLTRSIRTPRNTRKKIGVPGAGHHRICA